MSRTEESYTKPRPINKVARRLIAGGIPLEDHREFLIKNLIDKGITQEALAFALDVTQGMLSKYTTTLGLDVFYRQPSIVNPRKRRSKSRRLVFLNQDAIFPPGH